MHCGTKGTEGIETEGDRMEAARPKAPSAEREAAKNNEREAKPPSDMDDFEDFAN